MGETKCTLCDDTENAPQHQPPNRYGRHDFSPALSSGSVEPMTETLRDAADFLGLKLVPNDGVRPASMSYVTPDELVQRMLAQLQSPSALREAAEKARSLLNMAVYIANKNGRQDCVIAVSLVSEVETALRASLASSGTTETSRARTE